MRFLVGIFLVGIFVAGSCPAVAMADKPLTWVDCLRETAENHPDLLAAQEGVAQQQELKIIAASNVLPNITADLNASTAHLTSTGSSNSFSYGASASQLLFDGFKSINNIHSAAANIKAAKENFRFTSAGVRLRLRVAFITLLKAQESLNLTREIYNIRKGNLELIALRYQSGTEHKGALLTARANLAQAKFDINQARRGIEVAQRQLIKELGRMQFTSIRVSGDFKVSDAVLKEPDVDAIVANNPSLLKIIAQKNAAAFDVKAEKSDFWPTVSLNGGVSRTGSDWPPDPRGSSAGLKVSLPLFEGGSRVAKVAQAASVYRQLQQQERSLKDDLTVGLVERWSEMQDAIENVAVQQGFLNAAQERAKIAEGQYSVGRISFDNWTIIEDTLVRNKKSFLDVQANALLAQANWIQAKGETLEYEN